MAKKPVAKGSASNRPKKVNKALLKAKRDHQPRAGGSSSAHAT